MYHMSSKTRRGLSVLGPLELELWTVVSLLIYVLGTKPGALQEQSMLLTAGPSPQLLPCLKRES